MNARLVREPVSLPRLLSWAAKVCGVVLFVSWVGFVVSELFINHFEMPDIEAFYQAGALVVVFGGYLLSRKHALAGSLIAIVGTLCFFAIAFATSGVVPQLGAAWFAVPAVLTLAAWGYNRRRRHLHNPRTC
jgi:hypothetical protein